MDGYDMTSSAPVPPTGDADAVAIVARALHDPEGSTRASQGIGAASRHRVLLLAGWTLRAAGTLNGWPVEFIGAFQRAERRAITVDCLRDAELETVLSQL